MARHIALTQKSDDMEWVSLMIAKSGFSENVKLETHVRLKEGSQGIGFLLNMKPIEEKQDFFQDALLLWIGSQDNPGCSLFRSNVELLTTPELLLAPNLSHFIRIEKTDYHVRLYIDNVLAFDYLSYIPSHGPHFGLMLKDDDLEVGTILVSSSSPNIQVNCLAVPDSFLALGYHRPALSKYRQIASSFQGRAEGKEATFRAGLTLLEAAGKAQEPRRKEGLVEEALEEFDKLREPPGSPLEYLGKSLVYKTTNDLQEEIKCLELSLRKFAKHPLIHRVKDQVLFRLHEASYKNRRAAYELALLALRQLPSAFLKPDNQKLLNHLRKNCEPLSFIENDLPLQIAFWLCKPSALVEIFQQDSSLEKKEEALYCLLYLGFEQLAKELFDSTPELTSLEWIFSPKEQLDPNMPERPLLYLLDRAFFASSSRRRELLLFLDKLPALSPEAAEKRVELLLLEGRLEEVKQKQSGPYREFLQLCLELDKGIQPKEIFSRSFEKLTSPYLVDYFLSATRHEKNKWLKGAFYFEKILLLRQLALVYRCSSQANRYKQAIHSLRKEFKKIQSLS